jgi:hypothetical protein
MRRLSRILPLLAALASLQPADPHRTGESFNKARPVIATGAGGQRDIFIRVVSEELHKRWPAAGD